jgi:hypothetical protein
MEAYAGLQYVGIDLHRRRTVIVRTTEAGEVLEAVRIGEWGCVQVPRVSRSSLGFGYGRGAWFRRGTCRRG